MSVEKRIVECVQDFNKLTSESTEDERKQLCAVINKNLGIIDALVHVPNPNDSGTQVVAQAIINEDFIPTFTDKMDMFDDEGRQLFKSIFFEMLQHQIKDRHVLVEYLLDKDIVLYNLFKGYEKAHIATFCGEMIRIMAKNRSPFCESMMANDEYLLSLFDVITKSTPEISTDAALTLKTILLDNVLITDNFLSHKFDQFRSGIQRSLSVEDEGTLVELLTLSVRVITRRNDHTLALRLMSCPDYLKEALRLLRHESKDVQMGAFNLFKLFLANPQKNQEILDILIPKKQELLEQMKGFHTQDEGEVFNDDKSFVIMVLSML